MDKNIFIGIDYSLTSTAISMILQDVDRYHVEHFSFINKNTISNKKLYKLYTYNFNIHPYENKFPIKTIYETIDYIEFFFNIIHNKLKTYEFEKNLKIHWCIEGLSYASYGNTILSIAGGLHLLINLICKFYPLDYNYIVQPKELKKFIGYGNMNKKEIINKFINDEFFISYFREQLKDKPIYFKPIDDIADSAYLAKYIFFKIKKETI